MPPKRQNTCAMCGVPIQSDHHLCGVCAKSATGKVAVVPCRACGATNPSSLPACISCGAPTQSGPVPARPSGNGSEHSSTRIIGRRAEMQALEDCFNVCVQHNRVSGAIVTGEPGMGASAVLKTFVQKLTGKLPMNRIWYASSRESTEQFAPFQRILRKRFEVFKEPDLVTCRRKMTHHVGRVLGADSVALVTETSHLLGHYIGVAFPESPVLRALEGDFPLLMQRIKESVVRFFEADAKQNGPAALVIDEVHRSSPHSQRFLMDILEALGPVPLMIVLGGHAEVGDLTGNQAVLRVTLQPLDEMAMTRLFRQFLSKLVDPPEELVAHTVERANGNPGSLRQLCALLTETGIIDTTSEPWTADITKVTAVDMPTSLTDTLKARLDRLDSRDKNVLQYAAVIGEVFWDEAVVALFRQRVRHKKAINAAQVWIDDSDGLTVSSTLDRLVARQFIVAIPDTDIKDCVKYAFVRSGIRDQILAQMDAKQRKREHFLVAQWLSHATGESKPHFATLEAIHWERAGESHRAALASFGAARYARSRYRNEKAIKLFQKGLELCDKRDRRVLIDAYHDIGSMYELAGQYEAAEMYFTEMLRNAWILAHRSKAGAALNKIGRLYRARSDTTAARAFLERGMALFKAAGDEKGVAACLGDLGELARRRGSYDRAFKLVNEALELQRKMNNLPSIAVCLHSLGHIEAARSSYTQAERYLEEAFELRSGAHDKGGMAQTLSTLGVVLFNKGSLDHAIVRWEAALNLAEEVGDRRMLAIVHNNLGEAYRDLGQYELAMKHFKACEKVVTRLDDRLLSAEVLRNMAILNDKMGDRKTALSQLKNSLKLARQSGGREMEGLALRALGELASTTLWDTSNVDAEDEAKVYLEGALAIFRDVGNELQSARTLHALGNRLLERGDVNAGKKRLEEAEELFKRLDTQRRDEIHRTIKEIQIDDEPDVRPPDRAPKGPTKKKRQNTKKTATKKRSIA